VPALGGWSSSTESRQTPPDLEVCRGGALGSVTGYDSVPLPRTGGVLHELRAVGATLHGDLPHDSDAAGVVLVLDELRLERRELLRLEHIVVGAGRHRDRFDLAQYLPEVLGVAAGSTPADTRRRNEGEPS
jgi:hypothetical protein